MPRIRDSELKILKVLLETKEKDGLTPSQVRGVTGIGSETTVAVGLRRLVEKGMAKRTQQRKYKATGITPYYVFLQEASNFLEEDSSTPIDIYFRSYGPVGQIVTERSAATSYSDLDQFFFDSVFYIQNSLIAAWVDRLSARYNQRTLRLVMGYLEELQSYMSRCALALPENTAPFAPVAIEPGSREAIDLLYTAIKYTMVKSSREHLGHRDMSFAKALLNRKVNLESNPELRALKEKLENRRSRARFEEFLEKCVPPKCLVILPVAGFEGVETKVFDYFLGSDTSIDPWKPYLDSGSPASDGVGAQEPTSAESEGESV